MNIRFTSYYTGGATEYRPGEIASIADAEAQRIIEVGGARALTAEEEAELPAQEKPAPKSKAKG